MSKIYKFKTSKFARDKYEWHADQPPSKKTKRAKAKERQEWRKASLVDMREVLAGILTETK